jgi:hypothetical protein
MTHYVVVKVGAQDEPVPGKFSGTGPGASVHVDGADYAKGMVTWLDGSKEARTLAKRAGFHLLEESVWEAYQKASFSDRAASGGRATKGVMTTKKLRALTRNAKKPRPRELFED